MCVFWYHDFSKLINEKNIVFAKLKIYVNLGDVNANWFRVLVT
jgi:hypothetical protein